MKGKALDSCFLDSCFLDSCLLAPAGAAAGRGRLRAASITFSPRAPHALIFSSCLSVAAARQHSSSSALQRASRLLAVAWLQAAPPHHWLSESAAPPAHWPREEKNSASIGWEKVSGRRDWSSSAAPSPWRLGLCKHPGCFISMESVCQCVQTEAASL